MAKKGQLRHYSRISLTWWFFFLPIFPFPNGCPGASQPASLQRGTVVCTSQSNAGQQPDQGGVWGGGGRPRALREIASGASRVHVTPRRHHSLACQPSPPAPSEGQQRAQQAIIPILAVTWKMFRGNLAGCGFSGAAGSPTPFAHTFAQQSEQHRCQDASRIPRRATF